MAKKIKPEPTPAVTALEAPIVGLVGGGDMDASDYKDAPESGQALTLDEAAKVMDDAIFAPILKQVMSEPLGTKENPIGKLDPTHKIFWRGNDINGNEHVGSGNDPSQCNIDAGLQGSATCHLRMNPDYVEPLAVTDDGNDITPDPTPSELNKFYQAGYADGFRYFEDLKALVVAWATEQNLSGGLPDVEALLFVTYCRYNP